MIDDFKATLGKRGFAKPSLFKIGFSGIPSALSNVRGTAEIIRDMELFAEAAEFPGTQILTQELRYYDMPAKFAYGKAHDDLNITFRLDRDFQIKKLFDVWVNYMYDRQTGDVYYKNVYAGELEIFQMMENGKPSYIVKLEDAFPTQIGQVSLGWDQGGSYSRLPVTFSFKRMRTIANPEVIRDQASSLSSPISQGERTINESLFEPKTQLTKMSDDGLGAYRQITVMNKTQLGGLLGGYDFA